VCIKLNFNQAVPNLSGKSAPLSQAKEHIHNKYYTYRFMVTINLYEAKKHLLNA